MKKGYGIGQFQRSGKVSLHFWNLAELGFETDHSELEHWYGSKMASKTQGETVNQPPPSLHTLKEHPSSG